MNFLTTNTKYYMVVLTVALLSLTSLTAQISTTIQVTTPINLTVECSAIPVAINPKAITTCEGRKIIFTFTETKISGTCPSAFTLIRKWDIADACGNKKTVEQKITVKDTKAPLIGFLPNIAVECSNITAAIKPIVIDECSKSNTLTLNETKDNNILCPDSYRLLRTWTAVDLCGNKSTRTQYITITDKTKPNFANVPPNVTVECIAIPPSTTPIVTDNCDKQVEISYKETNNIGKVNNTGCSYTMKREWTATDNCGNTNITTQFITIKDSKAPKFTTTITDITVACGKIPLPINPGAVDNCTKEVKVTLAETKTALNCPDTYILKRVWTAMDNCGNIAAQTQFITVQDKIAPSIFGVPSNVTMSCSQILTVPSKSVTASDDCDKQVDIIFKETKVNGNCPDTYGIKREWTAKDDCGNAATRTQNITVRDNLPPLFAQVPTNITVECSKIPNSSTIYASDNCDKKVDIILKETKINVICANSYVLTRTWTATDNCGNNKVTSQNITVNDFTAPKLVGVPPSIKLSCKDIIPAAATVNVTDNCATNLISKLNENITTGRCSKTIVRTWNATDACGNTTAATQVITIEDKEAPLPVVTPPATITLACGAAVPVAPALMFKDGCTENVTVSYAEEVIDSDNPNCSISKIIRRWTAKDTCGNATVVIQTVLIGTQGTGNKERLENNQITAKDNAVKENALSQNELAYPNPTDGALFISLKEKADEIQFTDELGRILLKKENISSGILNIDLSMYENGIYILQIKIGDTQKTQRIILAKP